MGQGGRWRVFGDPCIDRFGNGHHVRIVAAAQLEPQVCLPEIGRHEVPQIRGAVAAFKGQQGLGDSVLAVRDPVVCRRAEVQFAVNGLDDLINAVGFAHIGMVLDMGLERLNPAQHFGRLEQLSLSRLGIEQVQGLQPGSVACIIWRLDHALLSQRIEIIERL